MRTPADLSFEHQRVLDKFLARLKALIEAELLVGNPILHAGAGHPAPPTGELIMLEHDRLMARFLRYATSHPGPTIILA